MELIGQRMLDGLNAVDAYAAAYDATDGAQQVRHVSIARQLVQQTRQQQRALGEEFQRIWLRESKPYALDWTLKRYREADKWYETLENKLASAQQQAERGEVIPSPGELGLASPTAYTRQTRPFSVSRVPLRRDAPWQISSATHRLGITVDAGNVERFELPVEVDVSIPPGIAIRPLRAFWVREGGDVQEVLTQLDAVADSGKQRLTLLIPGPIARGGKAEVEVYCGLPASVQPATTAASTEQTGGAFRRMENNALKLLLGVEGAHIYQCQVKGAGDCDLTMPGQTGWAGLADLGGNHREAINKLVCTAHGPALVRLRL